MFSAVNYGDERTNVLKWKTITCIKTEKKLSYNHENPVLSAFEAIWA